MNEVGGGDRSGDTSLVFDPVKVPLHSHHTVA